VRVAAIFGPGASDKYLNAFRKNSEAAWLVDLRAHSDQTDAILIFGGDGTIHRHLAQLVELRLPVLVVPCGSGNDFARALRLPRVRDSLAAWRSFCSGANNVRTIDLGTITPAKQGAGETPQARHYFCCVGGVGLDADIARRANGLPRWLRARGGYALSLFPALLKFVPLRVKISDIRDPQARGHQDNSIIVAAFANAPSYGGGMKIAPQAQLDDGLLDVCIISPMNKFKLFCLFPTIYFGNHLSIPQVEYFQAGRFKLETEESHDVYADGEYVCRTPIEVGVARGALRVIVP
jgi:diacylglycerol kinase (ATP)